MTAVHNSWYAQIDGQIYGPYTHALMADYVAEGRIVAGSMITANPDKGFVTADRYPQFQEWLPQAQQSMAAVEMDQKIAVGDGITHTALQPATHMQPQTPRQAQPSYHSAPRTQTTAQHQPAASPETHMAVYVVMAEIRSGQAMGFLQTLQSFGTAQRVGDSVWLVKSQTNAQILRNALSQTLTKQDRLFIVDSFANETAWFNIGQDLDARIRDLWT